MNENMAIQLLQMEKEVLVDSRIVAKGIGIEHESLMKTIYTYQTELEEFGPLRFQIGPKTGAKAKAGGDSPKYVLLNRDQAGVVISFSRNTAQVVRFKVDLFKAINAMEKQLAVTQKQLTDAKVLVKALVEDVHKLPWGLDRVELGMTEMTCHRIMQFAEKVETQLRRGALTDKRAQEILEALASMRKDVASVHGTLREDVEMNHRIDNLFFSFYDVIHPKLPGPNDK